MTPTPKEQREGLEHENDHGKAASHVIAMYVDALNKDGSPRRAILHGLIESAIKKVAAQKDAQITALQLEVVAAHEALNGILEFEGEHCACGYEGCDITTKAWDKARAVLTIPSPTADAVKKKLEAGEKCARRLNSIIRDFDGTDVVTCDERDAVKSAKEAGIPCE